MLVLFYQKIRRTAFAFYDQLRMDDILQILPSDIQVTFDRDKMSIADVIVFNLPFLLQSMDGNLEKQPGQIWVAWSYESEVNYPWMLSGELKLLFDFWMTYHLDADIVLPYYDYTFKEKLLTPPVEKSKDVCMFVSSNVNNSRRQEYLSELMEHIHIDSYGRWRRNCILEGDKGYVSKLDVIKHYKFTIAFENAISPEYVTEKFFDPLIAGSVPVYLGAPDVDKLAPGLHAYIDVRNYDSPKSLAKELQRYCCNRNLYDKLLEWKRRPLNVTLANLIEEQHIHPFIRMAMLAKEKMHKVL